MMRVLFFVILAIVLMTYDHRSSSFHRFRQNIAVIVYPIQMIVNAPIQWVHQVAVALAGQQRLIQENAQLKARELLMRSKLQKLLSVEHENDQLKNLLKSASHVSGEAKIAQLLAVNMDPNVQQVVLDKGRRDHVYRGQPVLDAYGVLGQVIDVGAYTSKVLLLTDSRFSIPVRDQRNGFRAIASGMGAMNQLELLHVNNENKVAVGDLLVTSGLGLHFPAGYPVGVVSSVMKVPGEQFVHVMLVPSSHFDQTQQVILLWPTKNSMKKDS